MSDPVVAIGPPDLMALCFIARNLRQADADEIFAGAIPGPDALAMATMRAGSHQWVAWYKGQPVASFGGQQAWPGVYNVWMFTTAEWDRVALAVTKHIQRVMIPALIENGGHRGQCLSMATHTVAHRWLEYLGFVREGVMRRYGRGGEDFVMYAWRDE